jgi:ABC-type Fe3+-hydroxamate transport system substrate-binding protein
MPGFIDQTGRQIIPDSIPSGIISVVPSLTELLYDLQLGNEVIAITKFCVHPSQWFLTKPKIGGTKNLDIQTIIELKPGLIIANKEENVKEQVEELAKHFPVWISDVHDRPSAIQAIQQIGLLTGKYEGATKLTAAIDHNFKSLHKSASRVQACYLIWRKPYMTTGSGTFIHAMMEEAGFDNVFRDKERYPQITLEDIAQKKPGYILLSSEPFPFKQKHADEIKEMLPGCNAVLVDGEMFSWYGSRMLKAPAYFLNLWQHGIHRK